MAVFLVFHINSYIKNATLWTDRWTDRQTVTLILVGLGNLKVPPGSAFVLAH